ncbi:MAG: hypothetical protein ACI4D6_12230 [Chordicoccus sp.]
MEIITKKLQNITLPAITPVRKDKKTGKRGHADFSLPDSFEVSVI